MSWVLLGRPKATLPVLPSLPAGSWVGQCRPGPSPDTHPCPWWQPAACSSPLSPAGRCPSASSPPPPAAAAPSPWPPASSQPSPDRGTVQCQQASVITCYDEMRVLWKTSATKSHLFLTTSCLNWKDWWSFNVIYIKTVAADRVQFVQQWTYITQNRDEWNLAISCFGAGLFK